jgi:hypothetical protein
MMRCLAIVVLFFIPLMVEAMQLSEIAWMGTSDSHDDEWIELFNNEATTSLDGWVLSWGSTSVLLSGAVPAGAYVVLKRSGDTTAPGTAFLTYSGALPNGGAAVLLKDASGIVMDAVYASSGWPAGDNDTKATMQRTTAGWVTASPTAGSGALSSTADTSPNVSTATGASLPTTIRPRTEIVREASVEKERKISVSAPTVGYVGQEVVFTSTVTGVGERFVPSLRYDWNFGDMNIASGQEVTHVYEQAGNFVVTVLAYFGEVELEERITVEIREISLRLERTNDGAIKIYNEADYEVALDGYKIQGVTAKTFPPRSILLPGSAVTVTAAAVGAGRDTPILLYDRLGMVVASSGDTEASVSAERTVVATPVVASRSSVNAVSRVSGATLHPEESQAVATSTVAEALVATTSKTTKQRRDPGYPYYVLLAVLLFGTAGVLVKRS